MSHDHAKELRVNGTDDWCDDCHGCTHMPWCPSYEQPSSEAHQLCPDGISAIGHGKAGNEQPASAAGSEHAHCWHERREAASFCCGCEDLPHGQPAPTAPETGEEWSYNFSDGEYHIREQGNGDCVAHTKNYHHAMRIVKEHDSHQLLIDSLKQIHAALPDGIRLTPVETKIATIVADALSSIAKESEQ